MTIKVHESNSHHCNNLDDLKPLIGQLGNTVDDDKSHENDLEAVAISKERTHFLSAPKAIIVLNKKTGQMSVTDNTR